MIRAQVAEEMAAPQAVEAARHAAIEAPRVYLNVTPDQFAAIMRHHTEEE